MLLGAAEPGWCPQWQMGASGEQNYYSRHHAHVWEQSESSCFFRCDETPTCMQAVYETADSPWGAQCWLGLNNMTKLPSASRDCLAPGCTDFCYSKLGWGAAVSPPASPSPPPPPPPPPSPLPGSLLGGEKPGWCPNWALGAGGDQSYYSSHRSHAHLWESEQDSCFHLCDRTPTCMQAIYETPDSPWGAQCWLGLNNMTTLPKGPRRCRSPGCTDVCYSKHGWPPDPPPPPAPLPPTPPPPKPPSSPPNFYGYTYLGCYRDNNATYPSDFAYYAGPHHLFDSCNKKCAERGNIYFAMQVCSPPCLASPCLTCLVSPRLACWPRLPCLPCLALTRLVLLSSERQRVLL